MAQPLSSAIGRRKYWLWVVRVGFGLVAGLSFVGVQTISSASSAVAGQEDPPVRQLEPGRPIERELAGGQSHPYRLALAAGQYARLVIDQRGLDVTAQVLGTDGKPFLEFDSESKPWGPESVSLVAEAAGDYRLVVSPKQKGAPAGRYEIRLEELREATANDRALQEAQRLFAEARRLLEAGKYGEALPPAERALEIRERISGAEHLSLSPILSGLAMIHYYMGEYAKSEPLIQRALAIREKALGPDHLDVASSLNGLANLYSEKSDYDKAEPLYLRSLAIREKALGPDHPEVGATLNNLAITYKGKGEYAKAEPLYLRALSIREKAFGPEHREVASSLHGLGSFYWEKNDYARAEPLYLRALSIWERTLGPEHPIVAASLNNLGMIYNDTGEYAKAEALLMRALAINEKALGPNHPNVAKSLDSLADIYRERGDFTKAEQFYERARAIREKAFGPEHQEVTVSLGHLGLVYRGRGDYEKAEPIYRRTLATLEKELGPDHTMVAAALSNLGALYQEKGEYAKTEPLLQRALSIWEKALGPDNADVGLCLSNLGVFYMDRNDYAKAGPLLTRAQAIWEKALGPDHPDVAISLSNLGLLYFNQGDYLKAEPFHQRALAIREKALGPDHHSVAKTLNYLTLVSMARGEIQRAVAFQSRANAVSEHNLTLNLLTGSERQKLAYLALFTKETDLTLTLHSRAAPNDPQALELAFATLLRRKGRGLDAMTDTITALRSHAAPQDQELFDRLAAARSRLATLTLKDAGAANPELYRLQIKPLEDQIEGLEAALSARSAPFRSQSQPVTIAAVQAALPADGALIEFTAFTPMDLRTGDPQPPRYLAYVLSAQGPPRSVDLGPAAPIDRAVKAWRRSLRETRPDVKSLARVVDEKIMRPVRALLPQEGSVHRLLIAPDGQLNLIPFAALVDQQNRYLVERYSISYLTSGRDLLRLQTMPPSRNAPLVVANPIFGGGTLVATRSVQLAGGKSAGKPAGHQGKSTTDSPEYFFKPLPATGREAQAIKAVLPEAAVLVRESATEAKLKQLKAPSLLHIATHGFFLDDQPAAPALTRSLTAAESPEGAGLRLSRWAAKIGNPLLRSGLALAGANDHAGGDDDGLLTALEATSLDLWGTQLVVLSACDTGVGQVMKGEGVYGLRRALVLAGSETQVMSLWPVPDSETSSLMVGYYGRLMKDEGRGEALRQIQLEMLKDAKLRHPYYWASFVQAGEWANLEGRR